MEQIECRCIAEKKPVKELLKDKKPVFPPHAYTIRFIHPYEVLYTGSPRTAVPQLLHPDVLDICCESPGKNGADYKNTDYLAELLCIPETPAVFHNLLSLSFIQHS